MNLKTLAISFLCLIAAHFAQAQTVIRQYDFVTDGNTFPQSQDVTWMQGESVRWNVTVRRGNYAVPITSTSYPVIRAWSGANVNVLYASNTGTVVDAASGRIRIDLNANEAAISPTGLYNYAIAVYDGTNYMGVAASGRATIKGYPFSGGGYVGVQYPYAGITNAVFINGVSGGLTGQTLTVSGYTGVITGNQHNAILGGLTVSNALQFGSTPSVTTNARSMYWDVDEHTVSVPMESGGVVGQMFKEGYIYGQNKAGRTVTNGTAVKIVADPGGTGIRFDLASSTNSVGRGHFIGLVTQSTITNNGYGYVTTWGEVHDVNTAAFTNGDDLYLDGDGIITNIPPSPPAYPVHIGYVVRSHASLGVVYVRGGNVELDPVWSTVSNSISTSIAGKLATNGVQAGGLGGVLITNAGGIVYISATNTGGGGGSVTNGQWLPDVYAVGITASGALQRTGGTMSSQLNINVSAGINIVRDFVFRGWRGSNGEVDIVVESETSAWQNAGMIFENNVDFWHIGTTNDSFIIHQKDGPNGTGTVYISQGLTVLDGPIRGNGSGITNITGLAGKLDSNVWAAADSTTNYVAKTGGSFTAVDWSFKQLGDSPALTVNSAYAALDSDGSSVLAYEGGGIGLFGNTTNSGTFTASLFLGAGSGLTGLNGASITNFSGSGLTTNSFANSSTITWTSTGGVMSAASAGGGSVTLRTNYLMRLPSHPGSWSRATDVATNGALAIAMEQFATTSRTYRSSLRTSGSLTNQTTTIYGEPWCLSSVASNHGTISVVYDSSAGATGVISFVAHDATNVLLSFTLTTSGVYSASGTNLAGARIIDTDISATVTGQGGTNYGRFWIPDIYSAEQ